MAKHALPALSLWEALLDKKMTIVLMEDNAAACRVVITGRNPSMRHMTRTQRIDIAWLNERYLEQTFRFVECPSEYQAGDILTKHFTDVKVWERNLSLIGHFREDVFKEAFKSSKVATSIALPLDNELCETDVSVSASASNVHVPVRFTPYVNDVVNPMYTLINFCCFENSRLCDRQFHLGRCRTVIITEELDACSHKAIDLVRYACRNSGRKVVLWGSLPCTGGCTWNYINGRTPEGKAKIDEHVRKMTVLLQRFIVVAKIVQKFDGIVCFEWPSKCTYWKRNDVMQMI